MGLSRGAGLDPEQNRVTSHWGSGLPAGRQPHWTLPKPSSTEIHLGAGMRPFKPWLDFGATAMVRNDPASGTETLKSHTGFCRLLQGP